ncbi:MAG: T9SS type A sorting domain-containing protein, partial [Rhodothermales bacterium]
EDPPAAAGRIETMEDDRLTVEERTFLIDDSTRVLDASAAPISFSDLEVGLTVAVHARTAAAAAMPVAAQIKVVGEGDVASALEEAESDVPVRFVLGQNYPNPFNPQTTIRFSVPESAQVKLAVYDVLGREVRVLVDGTREAGRHEVVFDASGLPSGTYLVRLVTPAGSFVQTMQLMK